MAAINTLPSELSAAILSCLEDIKDLIRAICSCRNFYNSFKEHRGVPGAIVHTFFNPRFLPLAMATQHVPRLPSPRTASAVRAFTDELANPDGRLLFKLITRMTLPELYKMLDTHNAIASLASDMSKYAWRMYDYISGARLGDLRISPRESERFLRAFYRVEIFFKAFRTSAYIPDPEVVRQSQLWLVKSFPQIEIEQIACVNEYLERMLRVCGNDLFAYDLEMAAMGVDYCSWNDNPWMQRWISQGALFCWKFSKAIEATQQIMLVSALESDTAHLFRALQTQRDVYREDPSQAPTRPRDHGDDNVGPRYAYEFSHLDQFLDANSMPTGRPLVTSVATHDRGLRETAYVMWDIQRMERYKLWYHMEHATAYGGADATEADHVHMQSWWRVCGVIWKRRMRAGLWRRNAQSLEEESPEVESPGVEPSEVETSEEETSEGEPLEEAQGE